MDYFLICFIAARGGAHGFSAQPFSPAHVGFSNIALASVKVAVISVGIFSVGVIYVQAAGFGLNAAGVRAFAGSSGPLSQLAQTYVGQPMAAAIAAGATISAFAAVVIITTVCVLALFAAGIGHLPLYRPRLDRRGG